LSIQLHPVDAYQGPRLGLAAHIGSGWRQSQPTTSPVPGSMIVQASPIVQATASVFGP
jgi:hypothetical protein